MENAKLMALKENESAFKLKKEQDKIKLKFDRLKNIPARYFQAEYVTIQAEEICEYLRYLQLTPLSGWYSDMYKTISDGPFMSKYYLTFNSVEGIEPNYERIKELILPEPTPEDFPRSSLGAEFN